jgi:hypothetical protein
VLLGFVSAGACARTEDIHETLEAREQSCVTCHGSAFAYAANPPHRGQMPETCETCHATSRWKPAALPEHPWFALDGSHARATCGGCHTGAPPRYAGTPSDCASCHLPQYEGATHPVHVNVLPQTCGACHDPAAWAPATVTEHPWFTLDGRHLTAPCTGCHTGTPKRFDGTPSACVGCHLGDFQRSTVPGHQSFPQTCHDCHDTGGW